MEKATNPTYTADSYKLRKTPFWGQKTAVNITSFSVLATREYGIT